MPDVKTDVKFFDSDVGYWDFIDRQVPQREANYNTMGGTGERACANCQWFVAPNGCVVVENSPDPIVPNGLSDEWRAKVPVESMMAPLPVVIVGDGTSETTKAMKRERGQDFPPEDFAVVPDAEKPSDWKLRLTESPGTLTVAQIGRAITAMSPAGFRGNQVELTDDQKGQAVRRISGAIRRVDGEREQKVALRERLDDVKTLEVVIHAPEGKPLSQRLLSAIKEVVNKVTGPVEAKSLFDAKAIAATGTAFKVMKDANGNWRWLALVSNKFRDRDNPPEIFEEKSHKEFVSYLDGGGQFPQLWLWHTPGTKFGKADWADYQNGFLIMSGTVDGDKASVAEFLASRDDLGVSHGYSYLHSDKADGIIGWYRTHEVTVLPGEAAANAWASIEFLRKENFMTIEAGKRTFLVQALGEDAVRGLETGTQDVAKVLSDLGVESKQLDDDDAKTPQASATQNSGTQQDPNVTPTAAASAKEIAEALAETTAFKGLTDNIKSITDRVTALEATDDAKVAARFQAKAGGPTAGHIASQSNTNVKEGDDKDDGPTTDWFADMVEEHTGGMKVG